MPPATLQPLLGRHETSKTNKSQTLGLISGIIGLYVPPSIHIFLHIFNPLPTIPPLLHHNQHPPPLFLTPSQSYTLYHILASNSLLPRPCTQQSILHLPLPSDGSVLHCPSPPVTALLIIS